MSSLQSILIGGYPGGGLTTDKKPFLLSHEAYSKLENAYVWRERTKKRDGTTPMGRLRRVFTNQSVGNSGASPWTFNIYTLLGITPEANAEIEAGSVNISIATLANPFVDQGNGTLTNLSLGNSGTINYLTGSVTLTMSVGAGLAVTLSANYFPSLPVMGICKRDVSTSGIDFTIYFDTVYAYQFISQNMPTDGFQELSTVGPNNRWTGTSTDFFWYANFQGITPDIRLFFETNFNLNQTTVKYDPIRYYNGTWNNLQPILTDNPPSATQTKLWQAKILIPYYGRLLALNTWEGSTAAGAQGSVNFFARCRFSKIGDPTAVDSWRSDQFGKGGLLDAPTNEEIISAAFFRNTLIVFFEYSTWQLRYIGEYGVPFIFERISSDFGAISTFSPIVFDQGVMAVSNRGIIQAAANGITRLDEQIPETAFSFAIQNNAPNFVHGIRDFEKEVVYWNYIDKSVDQTYQSFPTTVLLFNYRNNTWAQFRDTITCFGPAQYQFGITWDSLTTSWDSNVSWDNANDQNDVNYIACGNQQGFVSIYEDPNAETPQPAPTDYAVSLSLMGIDFTQHPNVFTSPLHNLANDEIIYITNAAFSPINDPGINNQIYKVSVIDNNTFNLATWNQTDQDYDEVDLTTATVYVGAGRIALFPKMNIVGKDFNPFQDKGKQFKLSYIDFQMDTNEESPAITAVSVQLFVNAYLGAQANMITSSNQEVLNSSQTCGFITGASKTNPCVITSKDHSLAIGTIIYIANVQGMTQLNATLNTITVIDANTFSLNGVDASGFTTYSQGGTWNSIPTDGQLYIPGSQYAWYRFYSTQFGQYLRIGLTYDDTLMNQLATHQTPMELNAMNIWLKEGGRLIN